MRTFAKIVAVCGVSLLPMQALAAEPAAPAAAPAAAKPATAPAATGKAAKTGRLRGDTDNDGFISKQEFLAKPEKRFKELDANSDGKVSAAEFQAERDAKKARAAAKK